MMKLEKILSNGYMKDVLKNMRISKFIISISIFQIKSEIQKNYLK